MAGTKSPRSVEVGFSGGQAISLRLTPKAYDSCARRFSVETAGPRSNPPTDSSR